MDFPAQYPASPAKPLSGPTRARLAARHNRTSSLKPYSRRPSLIAPQSASITPSTSEANIAQSPSTPGRNLAVPSAQDAKSPFSSLRSASPLALFGSVSKVISRPFSWLASSSSVARSDTDAAPIPQSASTGSLSSLARKHAALGASVREHADDEQRDAPSLAARAVGARLAAGVLGSPQQHNDIESQSGTAADSLQVPTLRRGVRKAARSALSPPPAAASSSRTSARASEAATGAHTLPAVRARRGRRVLNLDRADPEDGQMELLKSRSPSPAASAVSAVSPKARQRLSVGQGTHAGSNLGDFATVGHKRGSFLRPDDSLDARMTPSQSSPSFAFGYGSERRVARSSFGLPPTASPFQLATRSSLAPRAGRPSLGPSLEQSPQLFRGGSLGPGSVAGDSYRASSPAMRGTTAKRRDWGSLGLAASRSPGPGDDMMREYIATRKLPGTAPRSLGMQVFSNPRSSRAGSVVADDAMSPAPSRLGKRDADMSVDGNDYDDLPMASARKRQMVWHPQFGFISQEELRAREPRPPSPKNEAERLLSVLESMKGAQKGSLLRSGNGSGTGVAGSTASRMMLQPISVPAPVSDRSLAASSGKANSKLQSIGVAPYSRALRKNKLAQSQQTADERLSLRAKLRRSRPAPAAVEVEEIEGEDEHLTDEEQTQRSETETEDEEPSPPKRVAKHPVRRSRRIQARGGDGGNAEPDEDQEMEEQVAVKPQHVSKATGKAPAPATQKAEETAAEAEPAGAAATTGLVEAAVPKPTSQRISLAAAKPAAAAAGPTKKDNFSVRTQSENDGVRERSSLRQGATKKFRTHQSSGRISAWEEDLDDDDDLPGAEDLSKIKLPTNLFPSGFSFGSTSSSDSAVPASQAAVKPAVESDKPVAAASTSNFSFGAPADKAETSKDTDKAGDSAASKGPDASLLGRLGGFSAPIASSAVEAGSTTPAKPPPATSFSFAAPAKDSAKPAFSFGAPESAEGKELTLAASSIPPAAATSNFFSTPTEPIKAVEEDKEKKSGPVPNFFGSSLAKVEAKPAESGASSGASFSFGKPASSAPTFAGFGQPPASTNNKKEEPAKPATGFSFGAAPTSMPRAADTAKKPEETKPAVASTTPSFSFGQSAATPAVSAKPSSFGAALEKRSADSEPEKKGEAEPAAKKATAASSFSFGSPAGGVSSTAPPLFGGFGAAASSAAGDKKPEPANEVPNFFGSTATATAGASFDAAKPSEAKDTSTTASAATSTPSFMFGAPATSGSATTPSTDAPKLSFSFGAPSTSTTPAAAAAKTGGFSFGASSSSAAAAPSTPAATSFGGFATPTQAQVGNSEMMEDSPTAGASTAAPASQPKFTFGSPAPGAANGTTNGTSNGTSSPFGAPSGAGGVTGSSVPASKPMTFSFGVPAPAAGGSSTPSTPKFSAAQPPTSSTGMFGAPAVVSAPAPVSAPTAAFTFGSPAPSAQPPSAMFGNASSSSAPSPFGSTPSSPAPFTFGAPQPQAQQQQPAASTFTFGTPTAASQPQGFTFGSGANTPQAAPNGGTFTFGGQASSAGPSTNAAAPAPFTFGAPQSQPPTPGGGASPFAFNAAAPAPPAFGATPQPDAATATPPGSAGGLFNMGAAPTTGPGGRAIKPLRQRRRG
ncbi:hypothetical protein ACQY0O_004764 [Thecaphora frezii]